jgi:hypothetical protein
VDVGLPVNVLLDRAGRVAQIMVGEVPIATIEGALNKVLRPAA